MKHILTLSLCFLALSLSAQEDEGCEIIFAESFDSELCNSMTIPFDFDGILNEITINLTSFVGQECSYAGDLLIHILSPSYQSIIYGGIDYINMDPGAEYLGDFPQEWDLSQVDNLSINIGGFNLAGNGNSSGWNIAIINWNCEIGSGCYSGLWDIDITLHGEDIDNDGICDEVEPCVGALDTCGVCNGPGAVYECGCADIPEGDCDCDGNQLDDLGVCGGTCFDWNNDGLCDTAGCIYEYACNYDPAAVINDGSCLFSCCMDNTACNYSPEATEDDGSCDYTCCPGPGCCSIGHYWDWELEQCFDINPTDTNLDGCTDLNDLMDILAAYGDCAVAEFTCGDDIGHEGYNYSTVQIGDQCWFSENCRYLPEVSPSSASSTTSPYYYVYGYEGTDVTAAMSTEKYDTYGVLYNWPAVMTDEICPSNWHIPSDSEFTQLTAFLGGESVAGGKMKEAGYDHWNSPNTGATNSSGFTGLPGGSRWNGGFNNDGSFGLWWSASELVGGDGSWGRGLVSYGGDVHSYNNVRWDGFSARCIKD